MAEQYRETSHCRASIAQVRITQGSEKFAANKKDVDGYLDLEILEMVAKAPSEVTDLEESLDVIVKVAGGGFIDQTGATRQGLFRALVETDEELRPALRKAGSLTRDPRMKERKKYGSKKARKAPQFSRR